MFNIRPFSNNLSLKKQKWLNLKTLLTIRADKLFGFIHMIKKGKVAKHANFSLLKKQLSIMSSYKKILEERISLL